MEDCIEDEVQQHRSYGLGESDIEDEATTRLKMIVFGQVSSYIHVMMTLNLQASFIESLIESYGERFSLDREDLRTLMTPFLPTAPSLEGLPELKEFAGEALSYEDSEEFTSWQ